MIETAHSAIAYRSKSFHSSASATTGVTATEPAGTVQNDVIFAFFMGNGSSTVTPPTGWTTLASVSANGLYTRLFWIRRGASAPSYAFSWSSASEYELSLTSWSGAVTTGNPYNVNTTGPATQRSPGNPNCPAVTTTVANTVVICFGATYREFSTGGATPPTGYTLVQGQASTKLGVAYKDLAAIGTEDPGAFSNAVATNSDIMEMTVALKPEPSKVKHRVIAY